jgi:hypothetical protein
MRFAKLLAASVACSCILLEQAGARAADQDFVAPNPTPQVPAADGAACPTCEPAKPCGPSCYGSIEALFWWTKHAPVVPLITTNPDPNSIASLAEPGTTILFGDKPIDFGNITGIRGTLGCLVCDSTAGVEGIIWGLPKQGRTFTAASAGVDGPVIAVPISSTVTNIPVGTVPLGETSFNAGNVPSLIRANATTELWGADVLGVVILHSHEHSYCSIVGGFKYIDLRESLTLDQVFFDATVPGSLSIHDGFSTKNQFYGAAAGLRVGFGCKRIGLDLAGQVAVGPSRQQYTAVGSTTATPGAFGLTGGTTPGGTFALPSNIGTFSKNECIVVPQGQAKVTVDVLCHLSLFAAYDFLYMNSVLRASNQIDRNINPTQNTILQPTTGVPAPLPNFNRTDYWAQGVSFGLEFRY